MTSQYDTAYDAAAWYLTTAAELRRLARHPSAEVRCIVAARRDLTEATTRILGADASADVRMTLACRSPTLPEGMVATLARDPSARVRVAMARRADCPPALRRAMLADPDAGVRSVAREMTALGAVVYLG